MDLLRTFKSWSCKHIHICLKWSLHIVNLGRFKNTSSILQERRTANMLKPCFSVNSLEVQIKSSLNRHYFKHFMNAGACLYINSTDMRNRFGFLLFLTRPLFTTTWATFVNLSFHVVFNCAAIVSLNIANSFAILVQTSVWSLFFI